MKYVPDFVPNDLKQYERDGLLTSYDQMKCERFLEDVNNHFANTKIVNFELINKWLKGEEVSEETLRNYQTVQNVEVFGYPIKERKNSVSCSEFLCKNRCFCFKGVS